MNIGNCILTPSIRWSLLHPLLILFFLSSLALVSCDSRPSSEKTEPSNQKEADLSQDQLYSDYRFATDEKTIDFATQPLAVPTGTLAEIIRRDLILQEELDRIGYSLNLHPFHKGKDINFFMQRGDLELAVAGDMPTLSATARDTAVALAMVKQNFASIIARDAMTLPELKGKRIGYAPGSTAHYTLISALNDAGLSAEDVVLVKLNVDEMIAAFENESIDAFSAWEPTPTMALKQLKQAHVIHKGITSSYLYCSKTFFQQHQDAVRIIVAALARAIKWLSLSKDNITFAASWSHDAVASFSGKDSSLSMDEYGVLVEEGIVSIASSPIIPLRLLRERGQLHNEFLFLQSSGKIGATVSWQDTLQNLNRAVMTETLSNPEQYRLTEYNYK